MLSINLSKVFIINKNIHQMKINYLSKLTKLKSYQVFLEKLCSKVSNNDDALELNYEKNKK